MFRRRAREWLERLKTMVAPYLRTAESELDLWEDTRLASGQQWNVEIQGALDKAGVGVALVSASFLDSSYVMNHELPAMIKAADEGGLRLLWVYISAAGWEQTQLVRFQATHDTKKPLEALSAWEQNEVLLGVARQMKEASLGATDRFKSKAS